MIKCLFWEVISCYLARKMLLEKIISEKIYNSLTAKLCKGTNKLHFKIYTKIASFFAFKFIDFNQPSFSFLSLHLIFFKHFINVCNVRSLMPLNNQTLKRTSVRRARGLRSVREWRVRKLIMIFFFIWSNWFNSFNAQMLLTLVTGN